MTRCEQNIGEAGMHKCPRPAEYRETIRFPIGEFTKTMCALCVIDHIRADIQWPGHQTVVRLERIEDE